MEVITMQSEAFQELIRRMDDINSAVTQKQKNPQDVFVDNQEFIQLMNISKRTAQAWRDDGIISFSQVGSKIYYRMGDIQKLLDSNYRSAFRKK
jgi:hypothetical protein